MDRTSVLGLITIGQSPRVDLTPDLSRFLPDVQIVEGGALDGLTPSQIHKLAPRPGQEVLVSRLNDGSEVHLAHAAVVDLVKQRIDDLTPSVDMIVLACTGEFPAVSSAKPLLQPDHVIVAAAETLLGMGPVGVLCPLPEQKAACLQKFGDRVPAHLIADASPYTSAPADLANAVESLTTAGAKYVLMDCMGYSEQMRAAVEHQVPNLAAAFTARALVAGFAAQILHSA
jgi:protein AroM